MGSDVGNAASLCVILANLFSVLFHLPKLADPSSINLLPKFHTTREGQGNFQKGIFSLTSLCPTINIHIHTYHRQTPAGLPLLPAGPGAWLGLD